MFHFKCSSELLPDGVVGDGVQEDDVPGDGHVRRQVVPHVLHHRLPGHAGSLRTNVKTGVLRICPIIAYLGQYYGCVYDVITDELIVLALNMVGDNLKEEIIEKVLYPDTGFMNAVNLFDALLNFRGAKPF